MPDDVDLVDAVSGGIPEGGLLSRVVDAAVDAVTGASFEVPDDVDLVDAVSGGVVDGGILPIQIPEDIVNEGEALWSNAVDAIGKYIDARERLAEGTGDVDNVQEAYEGLVAAVDALEEFKAANEDFTFPGLEDIESLPETIAGVIDLIESAKDKSVDLRSALSNLFPFLGNESGANAAEGAGGMDMDAKIAYLEQFAARIKEDAGDITASFSPVIDSIVNAFKAGYDGIESAKEEAGTQPDIESSLQRLYQSRFDTYKSLIEMDAMYLETVQKLKSSTPEDIEGWEQKFADSRQMLLDFLTEHPDFVDQLDQDFIDKYFNGDLELQVKPEIDPTDIGDAVETAADSVDPVELPVEMPEDVTEQAESLYGDVVSAISDYADAKNALDEAPAGSDTTELEVNVENAKANIDAAVLALEEFAAEHPEVDLTAVNEVRPAVEGALALLDSLPSVKRISIVAGFASSLNASASGTRNAPGGPTLVNEEGPELISENGRAYIAGGGAPSIVDLSRGAIVLNADDTKRALAGGKIGRSINALASGTVSKLELNKALLAASANIATKQQVKQNAAAQSTLAKNIAALVNVNNTKKNNSGGGGGGGGGGGSSSKSDDKKVDWIEVAIDRLTSAISALGKIFSSSFKTLAKRLEASSSEIEKMREAFDLYQRGYERYLQEADSVGLDPAIAELVRNGTVDIRSYDDNTQKLITDYKTWYEKALDCKAAIADLHEELAGLYQERFQTVQQNYENQLNRLESRAGMIEKDIKMAETRGLLDSADFYQTLSEIERNNIATLQRELSDLESYFAEAMSSGEIDEQSDAWYEMESSIQEVKDAIADANIQLEEYYNTIRSIRWDNFDYAIERFEKLTDEADFLVDILKNDKLFEDNGRMTNAGEVTAAMHIADYNAYMSQADAYAKEMQDIQRDLASDPNNTLLIQRREELLNLQQQSIRSAESEKDAIRDLVEEGINLELSALKDLIDAYKDSLDSAKDLYEYQKKVSEQSENIASIQKQLAAYAGDTSEENRARIQKLNKDLTKAQQELRETERDQSISEQKKILDDLYDEYEELLNEKLDDVNALMREMIERTNANLTEIRENVGQFAAEVGYAVSDGLNAVLYGDFANYNKTFEGISSANEYLNLIYMNVRAMAEASGLVKAYASGGLVDYTGYAMLHGSKNSPELVLDSDDTARFLRAAEVMRQTPYLSAMLSSSSGLPSVSQTGGGITIGAVELGGIQIDHVLDYNDLVSQLRDDPKFEKMIHIITDESYLGGSSFRKNRVKF